MNLPPLPWLSLGRSQTNSEIIKCNQSSSTHSLSLKGETCDKEHQEGENQMN